MSRHPPASARAAGFAACLAASLAAGLVAARPAGAATPVTAWDFEADDGGFTSGGDLPQWEWGEAVVGPSAAHSGTRLWGTDLDSLYLRENQLTLTLPEVDLAAIDEPVLVLWHWLDLADGDSAYLEVDLGAGFERADPVYGYDGDATFAGTDEQWQPLYLDLAGLDSARQVRLVLSSDAGRAYGWYVDDVQIWSGDAVPPLVEEVVAPDAWTRFDQGPTFQAQVRDDRQVETVVVRWSVDGGDEISTAMVDQGEGRYAATLPAVAPGELSWRIEASDGVNITSWPASGDGLTQVYLPAPTDLSGPAGRAWGTTVPLSWTAPDSSETVLGYVIYRDGEPVAQAEDSAVDAPAAGPVDTFEVAARFGTDLGEFEGRRSDPLALEVAVPVLDGLLPDQAFQGDRLRLELTGSFLLLSQDLVGPESLDLGTGITVEAVEVQHVDRAVFTIAVAEDAAVRTRDARLLLGDEEVLLDDAFSVASGDDRPALLSVSPSALEQGDEDTLVLTLNTEPAGVPTVDLGEGVVVQGVTVDGAEVHVEVAIANSASLGSRDVVMDDGLRILALEDGFRVWVRTESIDPDCACATGSPSRLTAGLLLLVLVGGARRRPAAGARADCDA